MLAGVKFAELGFKGITGAIGDAFMANEKFASAWGDLKTAMSAAFASAAKPASDFFANIVKGVAESIKQSAALEAAIKRLKGEIKTTGGSYSETMVNANKDADTFRKQIEILKESIATMSADGWNDQTRGIEEAQKELDGYEAALGKLVYQINEMDAETGGVGEAAMKQLEDIEKELAAAEAVIAEQRKKDFISEEEFGAKRLAAIGQYIEAVTKLKVESGKENGIIVNSLNRVCL